MPSSGDRAGDSPALVIPATVGSGAATGTGRWAAAVSYDGSRFAGWQTQPAGASRAPAIQDLVESALSEVAGARLRVTCAGRTDAGVHATGQIIHFDAPFARPESAWVRGSRRHLPPEVRLRWARPVCARFDARRSALARSYCYLVQDAVQASPLWRERAGHSARRLDLDRLASAASLLVGRHDFSAFRSSQCQARSPVRRVERIDWHREGAFLLCRITADGFLHHMVRNLVGTMMWVGDGRRSIDWPRQVLESRDRALAAPTFAAAGLYLVAVRYDATFGLPSEPAAGMLSSLA